MFNPNRVRKSINAKASLPQYMPNLPMPLLEALMASIPGARLLHNESGNVSILLEFSYKEDAQLLLCEALSEALPAI
jgi:hypothetical protein